MADEMTTNICPFCGQAVLDGDPRENCDCVGARDWLEKRMKEEE